MPSREPAWEPSAEDLARAGQWPVRRDVEYDEDGPAIMCNGQVLKDRKMSYSSNSGVSLQVTSASFPIECRTSFSGMTLDEIREDIARHLHHTEHVS